jgi:hypothetical protein
MQDPGQVNRDDNRLSDALAALELAPVRLSAREIWYESGLRAGRRATNRWRAAAALIAIGSLAIAFARLPARSVETASSRTPAPTIVTAADDPRSSASSAAAYARLLASLMASDSSRRKDDPPPAGDGMQGSGSSSEPANESISPTGWYRINDRG